MEVTMYTDGASKGNPGPSSVGIVIVDESEHIIRRQSKVIGVRTCNEAEYIALIEGLRLCQEIGATIINCVSDSKLVVEQCSRRWKTKSLVMKDLRIRAWTLAREFQAVSYTHRRREDYFIAMCDSLANQALCISPSQYRHDNYSTLNSPGATDDIRILN